MRLIIAGSRHLSGPAVRWEIAAHAPDGVTAVLDGGAAGVDLEGRLWAYGCGIPVLHYPADWSTHGASAGPIRNRAMVDAADALLLIWDVSPVRYAVVRCGVLCNSTPSRDVSRATQEAVSGERAQGYLTGNGQSGPNERSVTA